MLISLADTEARENLSQQVVGCELARDATERCVREPQFLGEELRPAKLPFGGLEVHPRRLKRPQVPLAREKNGFARGGPTRGAEDRLSQAIHSLAGFRGHCDRARGRYEPWLEIDFVVDRDVRRAHCNSGILL